MKCWEQPVWIYSIKHCSQLSECEEEKGKLVRSESIHTLAYSYSRPLHIIQIDDRYDFCDSNTTTHSSCLSANLCTGFPQESIIKISLKIIGFVSMQGFILLFFAFYKVIYQLATRFKSPY